MGKIAAADADGVGKPSPQTPPVRYCYRRCAAQGISLEAMERTLMQNISENSSHSPIISGMQNQCDAQGQMHPTTKEMGTMIRNSISNRFLHHTERT
ncbi:MAG: hypothetical protein ACYDER_22545 [Ktedonobacteraceae bacterium]